ncbi:helix-turn-helix domain-containing protein [Phenylobacterium montanum]|uniref:Helix-turn-helix domain-containing protein n=1 Tax=Phenylobacterium montanum TaxID=2823693 RepID=A0A975G5I4_9CAUL|nr:helix-turn-helix domain-containing protein [Caulobacter sp. S6]QUD90431.1 hypothetical protein KCG34_11480 [Caulobacter sp. S6]
MHDAELARLEVSQSLRIIPKRMTAASVAGAYAAHDRVRHAGQEGVAMAQAKPEHGAVIGVRTEARIDHAFADRALITALAAAALLGLDVKTLRALTDAEVIRAVTVNRVRRYSEAEIRRYLIEGPSAPCPSTNRTRAPTSNTTSSSRVVGISELRAKRLAAKQRPSKRS